MIRFPATSIQRDWFHVVATTVTPFTPETTRLPEGAVTERFSESVQGEGWNGLGGRLVLNVEVRVVGSPSLSVQETTAAVADGAEGAGPARSLARAPVVEGAEVTEAREAPAAHWSAPIDTRGPPVPAAPSGPPSMGRGLAERERTSTRSSTNPGAR